MKNLGFVALFAILAAAPTPVLAQSANAGAIMSASANSSAERADEKRSFATKWAKGDKAIINGNKDLAASTKKVAKAQKDAAKAQKSLDKANEVLAKQEKVRLEAVQQIAAGQQMKLEAEAGFAAAFPATPL